MDKPQQCIKLSFITVTSSRKNVPTSFGSMFSSQNTESLRNIFCRLCCKVPIMLKAEHKYPKEKNE